MIHPRISWATTVLPGPRAIRIAGLLACALGSLPGCASDTSSGTIDVSDSGGSAQDGTVDSSVGFPDSAGPADSGGFPEAGDSSDAAADGADGESSNTPDGARDGADDGSGSSYQGPCDVLTGGCAEAYSVTRAMTASYAGPLFQLGRISDGATLDVGQTRARAADMTTWSAFCGGAASNCAVSKIYAQVQAGGHNDLLPSVLQAPGGGPNCSAGGLTCAGQFTIETATGLPILTTVAPQEYILAGDNYAVGINGGTAAVSIAYNGKPVAGTTYCCGVFGLTHHYDATDTFGTDFMVALGYGFDDPPSGSGVNVNCGTASTYCAGAEEESENDLADYGSSPVDNALVVTEFDPSANAVSSYLNGKPLFSHSPPTATINAGTAIHLGGGGDLSQPDPVLMREALFTNTAMTASEVSALQANTGAFYAMLTFP
jgi:hypothetical protein